MMKRLLIGMVIVGSMASISSVAVAADSVPAQSTVMPQKNELQQKSDSLAMDYNQRGIYYAKQKSYEQAKADFLNAVSLAETESGRALYMNNLAMTYKNLGEYELALKTINQVLIYQPALVEALDTKGDILISLKRYSEADDYLTQSILLNPDVGTSYYNRGRVREYLGQKKDALQDYQKAVTLPGDYKTEAADRIKALKNGNYIF